MRRGGPQHPKVALLAAALGVPRYAAVGLLECLWHWTAAYAPRGDLGRYADDVIEAGIGWDGEAGHLVATLQRCHFLDPDSEARLVVHDWHMHADQSVQRVLLRLGTWFVNQRKGVGKASSSRASRRLASAVAEAKAEAGALLGEEVRGKGRTRTELREAFTQRFWPAYPPRNGQRAKRAEALEQWLKLAPDTGLEATILAAVKAYGQSDDYPVDAVRYLRHRRWEDETQARVARERPPSPARAIPDEKPTRSREEVAHVREIVDSLPFMRKLRG